MSSFLELGVPASLVAVLTATGKADPFPIQRDTLPDSLAGRDVLGRGKTGSGKTIAFAVPMVARLAASGHGGGGHPRVPKSPRGLVLAPTRELATQIAATFEPLAKAAHLRVATIFGGVSQKPQEAALAAGVDIVVACPGRLDDLMKQGVVRLDRVEITTLDEADHMADLGFLPVVTRILTATPIKGQRLLFSATLDRGVDGLVRRFLHDPTKHEVDDASVPQGEMTHRVFVVEDAAQKTELVEQLASGQGRRILFTRMKHQAKKLAKQLTARGIPAVELQGNLSQNARERNLAAFTSDPNAGGVRVLVATDVAARGVHVDDVELVIHVDPPAEHKAYLHRSGRTARAGASGTVVTVVLPEQRKEVIDLLRHAAIKAPLETVTPRSPEVAALVGPPAPRVTPPPAPAPTARPARQPSRSASSRRKASESPGTQPGRTSDSRGTQPRRPSDSGRTTNPGRAPETRRGSDSRGTNPRQAQPSRAESRAATSRDQTRPSRPSGSRRAQG